MAQQTAVEWFWKWQMDNPLANFKDAVIVYKQAKQMEKEQIIQAFDIACEDKDRIGKEYYYDTYGK